MIQLFDHLLNCVFPRHCLLCKKLGLDKALLCEACTQELPYHQGHQCQHCALLLLNSEANYCGNCQAKPPDFNHSVALFSYQEPVTHFVAALKFGQQLVYGELMGSLLAEKIKQESNIELPECLIPVPLHIKRLRERGYNQALCIAKTLAQGLKLPIDYEWVTRKKLTQPQSGLRAKQRLDNVKNAFSLQSTARYQSVALIDDVMTTGQTVNELAKCLKKAGVKRVEVWCVARA